MEKTIEFAGKKWNAEATEWNNYGKKRLYFKVNGRQEGFWDVSARKWQYKTNNSDWLKALEEAFKL